MESISETAVSCFLEERLFEELHDGHLSASFTTKTWMVAPVSALYELYPHKCGNFH